MINYLSPKKAISKTLSYILMAAVFFISWQYAGIAVVSGNSMSPTLENGDVIFVQKIAQRQAVELIRGDIVGFSAIFGGQKEIFVKRVVGLPGDSVYVSKNGEVFVNGQATEEPYVTFHEPQRSKEIEIQVPEGQLFVLGDNRADSYDSRAYGPVEIERVISKVMNK